MKEKPLYELTVVIEVRTAGMNYHRRDECNLEYHVRDRKVAKEKIKHALKGLLATAINPTYLREEHVMIEVSPGYMSVSEIGDIVEKALGPAELRL